MYPKKFKLADMFNPVWKRVARRLVKECHRCVQPRLDSIFSASITGEKPDCLGCSTSYRATRPLINRVFNKVDLTKEEVKKLMADPLIRRSMLNVVRGIAVDESFHNLSNITLV